MNHKNCDDVGDNLTPLQIAHQLLRNLDNTHDPENIKTILRSLPRSLSMSDQALVEQTLVDQTGLNRRIVMAFLREAETYKPELGYISTVDQAVKAYGDLLSQEYKVVVGCGSGLYVYQEASGHFEFISLDELRRHILDEMAGLPLVQRDSNVNSIINRLLSRFKDDKFFDDAKPGVNLQDGFITLDEEGALTLLEHSPAFKARMSLQVDYDADAPFDWLEAAFRATLPQAVLLETFQEVVGAILFNVTPSRDSVRRMIILHGARNSGKSTIIRMMMDLFPAEVVGSVPPGEWGNENARAMLEPLSLNCVTELGSGTRVLAEHVKKIVSGEPFTIRRLYQNAVSVTSRAWHLFATNELFRILDKTDAFERRLLVLTFPLSLADDQVDSAVVGRIKANPSAVLRWAANGAARLLRTGKFTMPPGHDLAVAEIQHGDDWPMIFAHTQIKKEPGSRITTTNLREALKAFARARGLDLDHVSDAMIRRVADVLQNKYGATRRKSNGQPFYDGIAFTFALQEAGDPSPADYDLEGL